MQIDSVGVIGVGAMGAMVARRFLEQGIEVFVYDRDLTRVNALVKAGACPAQIPADAAEQAEAVFVHVPDEIAAEDLLFDCGGVGETG